MHTQHMMGWNLLRSILGFMKSSSWKKPSKWVASTFSVEGKKKQSSRIEEFSRGGNMSKKVKNGSSSKTEEGIPCCHSKEKQLPSRKMKGGEEQAMKKTEVYYCSQDAGDMGAKQEDKVKNINSHFTHVHPKLPDYDDLVAKFKQLKKERMMSLESKQFEM